MADFDKLNRQTREFNNSNINRFNPSNSYNKHNFNYLNNQTYYSNNGQYSNYYSNR